MYFLDKIKIKIAKEINDVLKKDLVQAADLVYPVNQEHGDLSLSCFIIGKAIKKTPIEAAGLLVSKIKTDGLIAGTQAVGPYVNFTINKNKAFGEIIKEIENKKNDYGENKIGKNKKVMIEYSNANTHKEYHVGHLRNLCYGDSVNRILAANGWQAIPVSYINDFGIHVAKTIWWTFNEKNEAKNSLNEKNINQGYFLGQMYVEATKQLEGNETAKTEVGEVMQKIESRVGETYELWEKTRQWSIKEFDKIYQELGVEFVEIFYESEFINRGKEIVAELYAQHILEKSQGAIIANLEKYNLGVLMIYRTDGTALYAVADLALAMEKFKQYDLDKSIYVVDIRQSLYFKQLAKVMELAGFKKALLHLSYDFVKLPTGMMSSRTGNVITYEDLRAQLIDKAVIETGDRHTDWPDKKITDTAELITKGAMKFEMLKVSANQVISFDINQALRFDGFTAAYLQYTCARIYSIIRKAESGTQNGEAEENHLTVNGDGKEHYLIMSLGKYPETVMKAGAEYDPSVIAKYIFDLARSFNDYYHSVPVLKADVKTRAARLRLIGSVKQVITNGLELLGIEVMEEM
jgi:arginyl-tRNA synthetase